MDTLLKYFDSEDDIFLMKEDFSNYNKLVIKTKEEKEEFNLKKL